MKANIQFVEIKDDWSREVIKELDKIIGVTNPNEVLPPEGGVYRHGEDRYTVDEIEYAYVDGNAMIKVSVMKGVSERRKFRGLVPVPFPPY